MSTIFGGNTGLTYEQAQRKRALAEALLGNSIASAPQNMGEGWTALGQAFAGRIAGKKADKADAAGKAEATGLWDSIWGDHLAGKAGGAQAGGGMGGAVSAGGNYAKQTENPAGLPQGIVDAVDRVDPQYDPLSVIKGFEGFRETPYWDVNALRTGYGSDTVTMPDGSVQKVGEGTKVTREDADRDLARRVQTEFMPIAAKAVGEDVFASLPQPQQAALTSIAYNYGELPSSVAKAVQSGDPQAVASAIQGLGSHNNGINAGRRAKEAEIYLAGTGQAPGQVTMSAAGGDPAAAMPGQPGLQDVGKMLEALSNPYLPEAQKGVLAQLVEQALAPPPVADPMKALELEKAQLEVDAMRNPGQKIPPEAQERLYLMQQAGLDPNTPEGQQYLLTGKMPGLPGDGTEYGLQPVYGKDKDGNVVVLQIGKDGTAVQTKLPEGISPDLAVKAYETAQGTAEGKAAGEGVADLDVALSTMPGLEQTVSEMSELAGQASYTLPGQAYNAVAEKVFGAEPTEGSVAASKYQAMLDNVIMPVLKQTLGSQFTEADRVALSKSLGDPSASPAAKQATLEAFIRQKRLDVDAMTRLSGGDGGGVPTIDVNDDAAYDALPSGTEFMGSDGKKYRKP